jgi:hypothetical protein
VHGEELAYLFGIPICHVWPHVSTRYTRAEALLSAITITYFTNFAKTGYVVQCLLHSPKDIFDYEKC